MTSQSNRDRAQRYPFRGGVSTIREAADATGISKHSLMYRMRKGETLDEAVDHFLRKSKENLEKLYDKAKKLGMFKVFNEEGELVKSYDSQSDKMKKRWKDPEYRDKMSKDSSTRMKERWKDPKFRKSMSEKARLTMKSRWKNMSKKKRLQYKKRMVDNWKCPDFVKKQRESVKNYYAE